MHACTSVTVLRSAGGGGAAPAAAAQLWQMVDAAAAHHGVLAELKAAVAHTELS